MRNTRKASSRSKNSRSSMKGGFSNSANIWAFGICKVIIDRVDRTRNAPAGTKKSWRKCLEYLASRVSETPEDLYNKMTPIEFLKRVFEDGVLGKTQYGTFKNPWEKYREMWQRAAESRDAALAAGKTWGDDEALQLKPLPGK